MIILFSGSIKGFTQTGQIGIISRLNATLFHEIVKVIKNKPTAKIGFTGTLRLCLAQAVLMARVSAWRVVTVSLWNSLPQEYYYLSVQS